MEVEFEEFFQYLEKLSNSKEEDIEKVLKPLKFHFWMLRFKKFLKIFLLVASICLALYFIDILNWYFCAIGRILMIKFLPLWNWKYLGSSKCLIEKKILPSRQFKDNSFNAKNCILCEHFGERNLLHFFRHVSN